ncbi:hypothetical protein IBT54_004948 [Pantoea sp. S62]|nr:hypothetical protein [Pantoea sp. S62]
MHPYFKKFFSNNFTMIACNSLIAHLSLPPVRFVPEAEVDHVA